MKQRTSAVTRSPQQRSYVTQTRLARWHHSRSGPRSLGGDEPATKLLDSWEGADLCKPNEVWGEPQRQLLWRPRGSRTAQRSLGQNPRDRAQRPDSAFGKLNSAVWGAHFKPFRPNEVRSCRWGRDITGIRKPFRGSTAGRVFFPVCRNQDAVSLSFSPGLQMAGL